MDPKDITQVALLFILKALIVILTLEANAMKYFWLLLWYLAES